MSPISLLFLRSEFSFQYLLCDNGINSFKLCFTVECDIRLSSRGQGGVLQWEGVLLFLDALSVSDVDLKTFCGALP